MSFQTKVRFHCLGNEPDEANPCWDEDAQGVTHDADFWYFTRTHRLFKMRVTRSVARGSAEASSGIPDPLWNYHDTHGLGDSLDDYVGAGHKIRRARYDHFGDVDQFDGFLYTSGKHLSDSSPLLAYRIDWDALRNGELKLRFEREVGLQLPYALEHMQGGCFGPQRYLFLTDGYGTSFNTARGGIHVFDMDDHGRLVEKSSQGGSGLRFQFDPSLPKSEEPEGITWWDLDSDARAPGISGQLHAVLLDNDLTGDDVYLKHYRVRDLVDRAPYLHHSVRVERALPANDALLESPLLDIAVSARWRYFLTGGRPIRSLRADAPEQALASGGSAMAVDLGAALAGLGLDARRAPIGVTEIDEHLWMPLSGDEPAALVLRADGLDAVGVWRPPDGQAFAWVAINPRTRELYAGARTTSRVRRYAVDWDRVHRERALVSTALDEFRLVDALGRDRPVTRAAGACVTPAGHVLYLSESGGLLAFAVRGGRLVDASDDEVLAAGKGASFDERPRAGERSYGVAAWSDGDALVVETLMRSPADETAWVQFLSTPNEGSLGVGFIGNRRSKEVHKRHCVWVSRMNEDNKVFFDSPLTAAEQGYDGCGSCLRLYNTG
ncbi:hypothetical protein [Haliangium ochraceum]|uniref:Uncharacterized protein n=1 Tax=Haliangium ochraceum (strain DSM 14365 / JCM 11303 / SMP-2) TaxID=502025 RepID=D0LTC3_HALO1|nr:hypothetical protein [Haliangium ochraceum]ACY13818.1 hypothetical protein Hoch_1258 [Haliangium ochraceum DSM 14365]